MNRLIPTLALVLSMAIGTAAVPPVASAATLSLSAVGQASYGLHAGEYQNGDFKIVACCGEPNVGDATEEWTSWSWSVAGQAGAADFLSVDTLHSATLRLVFRTGGDTPGDDVLLGPWGTLAVFGFADRQAAYDITLDLVDMGLASNVLAGLKAGGPLSFSMGNDSSPYMAVLALSGMPASRVPVPGTLALAAFGLLMVWRSARGEPRKCLNCSTGKREIKRSPE
jgi:hypothetical protein